MSHNSTITEKAIALMRRCGTRDPFSIASELGINMMYTDALHRLKGIYRVIKRNRFIILNNKNSAELNRIVCAHELGHDQLHREYAKECALQEFMLYDMSTRREYEANVFAATLLLDDETVIELIEDGLDTVAIAAAMNTDINLVALKVDCLIRSGHNLRVQAHNSKFLK